MKITKSILFLTVLLLAFQSRAQTTNIINYQVVNGSVSNSIPLYDFSINPVKFVIQTGPITNPPVYVTNIVGSVTNVVNTITNAQAFKFRLSLDNTNFTYVTTWYPNSTNPAVSTPTVRFNPNLYLQVEVTTTNALPASVLKQ